MKNLCVDSTYDISKSLFSHTGRACTFGKLKNTKSKWFKERVDNYLDGYADSLTNEIMNRITEARENCARYHLTNSNCEHLATFVRYGVRVSRQVCRKLWSSATTSVHPTGRQKCKTYEARILLFPHRVVRSSSGFKT